MGDRFRMIVNEVDVIAPEQDLHELLIARAIWKARPDLRTAATAWILAGGAQHTGFSLALSAEHLEAYADMAGVEFLLIDRSTTIRQMKKELHWNDIYYGFTRGFEAQNRVTRQRPIYNHVGFNAGDREIELRKNGVRGLKHCSRRELHFPMPNGYRDHKEGGKQDTGTSHQ
jgi:hypothetical protein